mgnify:FL=1
MLFRSRIMAYNETPDSKAAVLEIAKTLDAHREYPSPPRFLQILPVTLDSEWKPRTDRVCFFRSYLVLNSMFFLSSQNILNLDLSTDAFIASIQSDADAARQCRLLVIQYPDTELATKAVAKFHDAYLPEFEKKTLEKSDSICYHTYQIEDGWTAYFQTNRIAVFVFECPDRDTALRILRQVEKNTSNQEDHDE